MTIKEFLLIVPDIIKILLFAGVLIGGYYYRHLDNLHKYLYHYIVLMIIVEMSAKFAKLLFGNNMIILPVYCAIELLYFTILYNKYLFKKENKVLKAVSLAAILYVICETLYYFVFNDMSVKAYQPYVKVADNFVVIIYALYFIFDRVNSFNEQRWDHFRLNIAILIAFTLTLIVFLPFNFLVNESTGIKYVFWSVNVIILLLFYGYLIWNIWRNGRIRKH